MQLSTVCSVVVMCWLAWVVSGGKPAEADAGGKPSQQDAVAALARCLRDKGFVMYGSFTCSACRAQRKAFGAAFASITEIECNPHAENTQAERCLERKIRTTPTWIAEHNGQELKRLEGYQLLPTLAAFAGCEF